MSEYRAGYNNHCYYDPQVVQVVSFLLCKQLDSQRLERYDEENPSSSPPLYTQEDDAISALTYHCFLTYFAYPVGVAQNSKLQLLDLQFAFPIWKQKFSIPTQNLPIG